MNTQPTPEEYLDQLYDEVKSGWYSSFQGYAAEGYPKTERANYQFACEDVMESISKTIIAIRKMNQAYKELEAVGPTEEPISI